MMKLHPQRRCIKARLNPEREQVGKNNARLQRKQLLLSYHKTIFIKASIFAPRLIKQHFYRHTNNQDEKLLTSMQNHAQLYHKNCIEEALTR
jgi:hypothetical protein